MHNNEELLTNLFQYLNVHDHKRMADCYDEDAAFRDIAFTLRGKRQIHAMWDMICSDNKEGVKSDIMATVRELSANDSTGRVVVLDDYTFRDTGQSVHNKIVSLFEFREGRIIKQTDTCDPVCWSRQAFGGFTGLIAGYVGFMRRYKAMIKLKEERPQAFLAS
jgi:ketosteroid isomerase-like protein